MRNQKCNKMGSKLQENPVPANSNFKHTSKNGKQETHETWTERERAKPRKSCSRSLKSMILTLPIIRIPTTWNLQKNWKIKHKNFLNPTKKVEKGSAEYSWIKKTIVTTPGREKGFLGPWNPIRWHTQTEASGSQDLGHI